MSRPKHTPGPWIVESVPLDAPGVTYRAYLIHRHYHTIPKDELDANEKLIAAAPSLLMALISARNALQTVKDHFDVSTTWHVSQSADLLEMIDELTELIVKTTDGDE